MKTILFLLIAMLCTLPLYSQYNDRSNNEFETDAMSELQFNGPGTSAFFGISVSDAGDVNGDGYDDIISGAHGFSNGKGRAYIYYGGITMNSTPDVILNGEASSNYFGISVSAAGDINGDGYDDVIVGAKGYNNFQGRAYIFFGGPLMNNAADITFTGEAINNYFGSVVSGAGDVNGDGFSDVVVGAYGFNSSTGKMYIYYGGLNMDAVADVTATGLAANNNFGISVSGCGDFNADGFSDVIAGASGVNSGTGNAYLYLGGASMDATVDAVFTGQGNNNYFGSCVSDAGDVNGDGFPDLIIGASGYANYLGRAYIYYGGLVINNVADVTLTGYNIGNSFAYSLSGINDINGDGYADVVVGDNGVTAYIGRASVFYGGANMNSIPDIILYGESVNNVFGSSVSGAGDVNGDGYSDFLVGAYGYNSSTGKAYIYKNSLTGSDLADIKFVGEAANNYFGYSVANAGDVNGDGYSDIIVGAPYYYNFYQGRAYIYFGGPSMDNVPDVTMTGQWSSGYFGSQVAAAGDVNGDGYSDVIVGSLYLGNAYIFYGGASMDGSADVIISTSGYNYFSVSTAGDVNGDGYSDVMVGNDANAQGSAFVYYGGASMNNVADITFKGETTSDRFGGSVSCAGDLNADGYTDLIIGANSYSSGKGRVYLYYGSSSPDTTADIILTGENAGDGFGVSLSGNCDINKDGFSDIIIGANGYSSLKGRAYSYYGGSSMDTYADVVLNGQNNGDQFGYSVSNAGDVNADGFSDIMVGAKYYDSHRGRSYIYFGRAGSIYQYDIWMNGKNTGGDEFGNSVGGGGDFNGDGYSDVIAGAAFNDDAGTDFGAAYVYLSTAPAVVPPLVHVKDVPADQGGKVNIKWARSAYDVAGINRITEYILYRSFPPVGGNFAWQSIADVSADNLPFYSFIDNTPNDSTSFFYRVKAKTNYANEYWYSGILSGHSTDNISPMMVQLFRSSLVSNSVQLTWKKNTEPDLFNYILYRSTSPSIDPSTATPYATVTDSTYLDISPLSGIYYYFIIAQDIHINKGLVSVTASPNISVNLTMYNEGLYDPSTNSQISDTIKGYLRNNFSPYSIIDSSTAVVSSNGISTLLFGNAPGGQYYIVITHRNSLETWSKAGGENLIRGSAVNYDFIYSYLNSFGNNVKQVDALPLRFGFYSGDVNQDGYIDLTDIVLIYNDASVFATGYIPTDLTGNNITDLTDLIIAYNNSSSFVSVLRP